MLFKKVLVVSAHPDDLELSCGGTIAKMIADGAQVTNLAMVGSVAHVKYLYLAADEIGYEALTYSNDKERFSVSSESVAEIDKFVSSFKPDLIITHWEEDWHQDHRACNELVAIIRRRQPVTVWHMSSYPYNLKYTRFNPNLYVDISDFSLQKYSAIKKYENISDWTDAVKSHDQWRGSFIDVAAAEVFNIENMVL